MGNGVGWVGGVGSCCVGDRLHYFSFPKNLRNLRNLRLQFPVEFIPFQSVDWLQREGSDGGGEEPEDEDGAGLAETGAGEAMGEVIGVADPEGDAAGGPVDGDLGDIEEGDGKDQEGIEDGEAVGGVVAGGIEVGKDGEDGEEESDEV